MEGSAKDPKPEQIPAAAPATATGGPLPGAVLRTRTLQRSATGDRVVLRSRTPHPRSGTYLPRGGDCQAEEDLDLEPLKARRAGSRAHMLCWFASSSLAATSATTALLMVRAAVAAPHSVQGKVLTTVASRAHRTVHCKWRCAKVCRGGWLTAGPWLAAAPGKPAISF